MGGSIEGDIQGMNLTQKEMPDPRTQQRQEHLFRQAEQYAGQSPFQQQYGYGSSMVPGLGGMSQTGQQYLTDKILGKGAYRVQNLGFQNYVRPDTAPAGGYEYGQSGYQAGDVFTPSRRTSDRQQRYIDAPDTYFNDNPDAVQPDEWGTWNDAQRREWITNQGTPLGMATAPGSTLPAAKMKTTEYTAANQGTTTGGGVAGLGLPRQPGPVPGQPGYVRPGRDRTDWSPWMGETYEEGAPSGMAGVNQPGYELNIWDTPDTPFGGQNLATATSGAQYAGREGTGGGLLQTDLGRPTSGVGIGEVEDARTATRRMLMESGRAADPGYEQFMDVDPATGKPTTWQGISAPGYRQFMDVPTGGTAPGTWEGIAPAAGTGAFLPAHTDASGDTYAAGWHGLGESGTGTAATDPTIGAAGDFAVPTADQLEIVGTDAAFDFSVAGDQDVDALTQWQTRDPETGEIATSGYAPEYDKIAAQALVPGAGELREAYTDIDVGTLADQYKGLSPEQITAARAGVEPAQISDEGYYGQGDPDAFGGASFLTGPAGFAPETVTETDAAGNVTTRQTTPIEAYMDTGGVQAQVGAAERDFQLAQNQEQARRAASHAWGTRGDIPRAEQEQQKLARIADIRRKGYTDAADRMEADLQREQAAGMQTQQLGTNAMMQMQQLEAQRQQAAAGRLQQSGLAGQQLGAEAAMQTQRLGVGADQRTAELGMQAALANQQAQLQTGGQQAELEARRRESVAQLGQQADIQTAQNELQAAMADQQAALSSGNQTAQLEAQRKIREAELQLQRGMQTQELGAGAAAQQTQNEFARRQALAGMGQDAATQQTQLEFARRQGLAEMGLTSAQQQSQNEFARRQGLAEMGLQAQGMGMDDQARFRQQQMQLAEQLGRQGLDEQAATFTAAQQLAQMGGTQEQRQQMQAAADYEQWLRSQEGFADEAAFLQAMQPQGGMAQYQRKPSVWGQVAGGLLAAGGTAAQAFGSDARIKDNIEYVGMENGFKTYEFNYLGRDNRYRGVMAQEVMLERPDAVEIEDGFYRVNYDAIGVEFEAV